MSFGQVDERPGGAPSFAVSWRVSLAHQKTHPKTIPKTLLMKHPMGQPMRDAYGIVWPRCAVSPDVGTVRIWSRQAATVARRPIKG